jgi:hypothetical protein
MSTDDRPDRTGTEGTTWLAGSWEWERDREPAAAASRSGADGDEAGGGSGERDDARPRERKERVLHTRISEQLADDIRALAEDLRVPVSNLVRNVLEEAFSVVEEVTDDVGELVDDVLDEAERVAWRFRRRRGRRRETREGRARRGDEGERPPGPSRPAEPARVEPPGAAPTFPEVVAWQPVVLNARRRCARTGRELAPGDEAWVGLTESGPSGTVLSREGLDALREAARR